MKALVLRLITLVLRRFGLQPAPLLASGHRTCTFCAGSVCRTCRLALRKDVIDGEFCSVRCRTIEESDRVPDHVVKPYTDAFVDMKFDER